MNEMKIKRPNGNHRSACGFSIGCATSSTSSDVLRRLPLGGSAYTAFDRLVCRSIAGKSAAVLSMFSDRINKMIQGGRVDHHMNLCGTPSAPQAGRAGTRTRARTFRSTCIAMLAAGLLLPGLLATTPAQAGVAERTVAALQALAGKGSARAQFELAQHYERGDGVQNDSRMALALYCRAARQDYADAALMAGRMHIGGVGGVGKDAELGRAWLRKAAALGSEQAVQLVGQPKANAKAPDRCEPPSIRWGVIRKPPAEIQAMVQKMAPTYGLDPELVLAVIAVESGYRVDAVSEKSAMGLMQLIPETAERFGVTKPYDPEQNLRGGMKYLRWLLAYFDGNVTFALAGYNAGEGAVLQYKGVPPYRETQDYVAKLHTLYARNYHPFNRDITQSAGLVSSTREEVAELSLTPKARGGGKR
ncbi:transglycosylase SLT domain-containing protein [Azospirillum picis]|uniref:Soluble lytic murein transglycosylase-like protein n=2 Tax=Azospirillum picis TaxID=488438 RepID=A0ABU0MTP4_9PROT|nr:transglycosylase SLT domain-containing protein [Azospirillum picis]MBP2303106.1 soluble lytic murein transglycosylase-like protein [Azospirillum picis]MDQ0536858.1 soluble lytic murein transglycosylase-like protein [Azospirillum picis]